MLWELCCFFDGLFHGMEEDGEGFKGCRAYFTAAGKELEQLKSVLVGVNRMRIRRSRAGIISHAGQSIIGAGRA